MLDGFGDPLDPGVDLAPGGKADHQVHKIVPDQRECGCPVLSEVLKGMGCPHEDVQRFAGAGGVEELGGGAPLLSSSGGMLGLDGGQVAQGACGRPAPTGCRPA